MNKRSGTTLLSIVFFASGFSGLAYQVAWQRILTLYYSVEHISTTLIVSVYMLGLGLGAMAGGYMDGRIKDKLRFYFLTELLIGAFGFISLPFLEVLGRHTAGSNYFLSFCAMFLFLGIPTMLMGMTLPILTGIFNKLRGNFLNIVSRLYFINTLGAAIGALVTSYIFISFWGVDTAIYIAAGINVSIAVAISACKQWYGAPQSLAAPLKADKPLSAADVFTNIQQVYFLVFITGFIAIGYEIIWFRFIGTLVKASAYSFSSILFVYLLAVALGSYSMDRYLARNTRTNRKTLFVAMQVAIAVYVLLSVAAYCFLAAHVPLFTQLNALSFNTALHPLLTPPSFHSCSSFIKWFFPLADIIIWPAVFVFVPALLMGAGFPLMAAMAYKNENAADTVGRIYFFNVLGNVAGGLITGLIFLQVLGSEHTLLLFSCVGFLFLLLHSKGKPAMRIAGCVVAVACSIAVFPSRHGLYKATHPLQFDAAGKMLISEGLDGVVVTYYSAQYLITYINGMSHGGRPGQPFYYRALTTMSYKKGLGNVLIIGFGTGSMVEALLKQTPKPKITMVELSHTLIENLEQVPDMHTILHDSNVQLIYADGRRFLYNDTTRYDAVFIDPLRSSTSFSNNLYSRQFFSLVSSHLSPGGLFMAWSDDAHVVPKTICTVFPYVHKFERFCIASGSELKEDQEYKAELFGRFPLYRRSLFKIDSLQHNYIQRDAIMNKNRVYPINEDYKPRSEYYLGISR